MTGTESAQSAASVLIVEGNSLEDEGRFEEAMERYHAALRADPSSARAYLNCGNVHLAQNAIEAARDAFEAALRLDPGYAAAHFNLGNTLARSGQMEAALASYSSALQLNADFVDAAVASGVAEESLGRIDDARLSYQKAVRLRPEYAEVHFNLGMLERSAGRLREAVPSFQNAIRAKPDFANAHFLLGSTLQALGEHGAAAASLRDALALQPDLFDAWRGLADSLRELGRNDEALQAYRSARELRPRDAVVYYNLGTTFHRLGRYADAVAQFRLAIEIQPDFYEAHNNLGAALYALHTGAARAEAIECFRRAIQIRPEAPDAHANLGNALAVGGEAGGAEDSLRRALAIAPDFGQAASALIGLLIGRGQVEEAFTIARDILERGETAQSKADFVACAKRMRFLHVDDFCRSAMTRALTEPWATPTELANPALSMIELDGELGACIERANQSWPRPLSEADLWGAAGLARAAADALLRALLESGPLPNLRVERFFTLARRALLDTASAPDGADPLDDDRLAFYAALAGQCYLNGYVYACDGSEAVELARLRAVLATALEERAPIAQIALVALAAYEPLHALRGVQRLLERPWSGALARLLAQQVREPLEERALRATIERITAIDSDVSERVRSQYEENPYPCWVKMVVPVDAPRVNAVLRDLFPLQSFVPLADDSAPELLIAGCGTGQHAIGTASRFRGARVLAIDISLSSLAYAKRKSLEMRVANISYAQGDIMNLASLGRQFDLIESGGVLHHLKEPYAGWRILLGLLRPGGLMRLGFYSELARRGVVRTRAFIAARGYRATPEGIRQFRQDLMDSDPGEGLHSVARAADFFDMNSCRDLLFHVQEERFTLEQIGQFLADTGLQFVGFESDPATLAAYRDRFPDDPAAINLVHWHRFELDHPDTFAGMYQFWVQKPTAQSGGAVAGVPRATALPATAPSAGRANGR